MTEQKIEVIETLKKIAPKRNQETKFACPTLPPCAYELLHSI